MFDDLETIRKAKSAFIPVICQKYNDAIKNEERIINCLLEYITELDINGLVNAKRMKSNCVLLFEPDKDNQATLDDIQLIIRNWLSFILIK